ncbi:MAG TPA: glycosyltransferase family 2 protein [Thermoleophilaceae bacterium]|nr:glycosyltransferase family 2 protein [Thermoleophilaceae bacterium]
MRVTEQAVSAVVLTHNRKELLAECLDALLAQTVPPATVHVIDNASGDGTRDYLSEHGFLERPQIRYERLETNRGGAGGFAHGVAVAREDGCDWIWLMDDDAEPRPDCLERLLASPPADSAGTVAVCPAVVGRDGGLQSLHRGELRGRPLPLPASAYGQEAVEVGFATFVGLLVRGAAARQLDPPVAEFFIWADDYEYCLRLRRLGSIQLVPAALIVHKDARPGFQTRRGRFFNRLLGWEVQATPYSQAWRNLCGIRNWVWMKQRHEGLSHVEFALVVARFVAKALMYDERPLQRIPWLVRFARDGRDGRFVTIGPDEWARLTRSGGA